MPFPKRTDQNQKEIVDALRKIGASVVSLHEVGKGCPDLLVGYRGINHLIEVKQEKGKLNTYQVNWHQNWNGYVGIAKSIDQALKIVG